MSQSPSFISGIDEVRASLGALFVGAVGAGM
jgi:hypothetical protein